MDKTAAEYHNYSRQLQEKINELETQMALIEAIVEERRNVETEITEVVEQLEEKREAAENSATTNEALNADIYETKIREARLRVEYRILQALEDGHQETWDQIFERLNTMRRAFWGNIPDGISEREYRILQALEDGYQETMDLFAFWGNNLLSLIDDEGDYEAGGDDSDDNENDDAVESDDADESDGACDDGNARDDDNGENDHADDDADARGDENVTVNQESRRSRLRVEKRGRSASNGEQSHNQSNHRSRSPRS